MKSIHALWVVLIGWAAIGCARLDDDISTSPDILLAFSADTVSFDTLLTDRLSITRRFRVFNTSGDDVNISQITVGEGRSSSFTLVVNGEKSKSIENVLLRGRDSLLVLVDAIINSQNLNMPFLIKDSVVFRWNGNQADVKLKAYGQDANFRGNEIICNEIWSPGKPYVITSDILIDTLCHLTVEAGTQIFLDNDVSMLVRGQLLVQGDTGQQRILFRNTRFDEGFMEAPGQWGGLVFFPGSRDNSISHATIENAQTGIFCFGTNSQPDRVSMAIDHSIIRHMSGSGIQAFSSELEISNSLVYNAGGFLFSAFVGGDYRFDHCTFSNEPNFFIRDEPSFVALDNFPQDPSIVDDLKLEVTHSILWGAEDNEVFINNAGGADLDTTFNLNIIKSDNEVLGNITSSTFNFPRFKDPFTFNYSLDTLSVAKDAAMGSQVMDDLTGARRDSLPDIGAFERIEP